MLSYNSKDVEGVNNLYLHLHKAELNQRINKLREQIDLCDDMQMREHLARKIVRLKRGMSIV